MHEIDPRAEAFIKGKEALKLVAYLDKGKIWTIGWGHTKGVHAGQVCTKEQAEAWFVEDYWDAAKPLEKKVKVTLSPAQWGALVSLSFNLGADGMPSLIKAINAGKPVETLWMQYVNVRNPDTNKLEFCQGLANRRRAELDLFHSDVSHETPVSPGAVTGAKPLAKSGTIWGSLGAILSGLMLYAQTAVDSITQFAGAYTTDFPPIRTALLSAGLNGKAIALSALIFCGAMVIQRRIKAKIEGKVG